MSDLYDHPARPVPRQVPPPPLLATNVSVLSYEEFLKVSTTLRGYCQPRFKKFGLDWAYSHNETDLFLLATVSTGETVGFLTATRVFLSPRIPQPGAMEVHVHLVCVAQEWRGKTDALAKMLDALKQLALNKTKATAPVYISLQAAFPALIPLYQQLGFEVTDAAFPDRMVSRNLREAKDPHVLPLSLARG